MAAFDDAFASTQILINDFEANLDHYLTPAYSEAAVRQDFIDKFFTILGWDVTHEFQKNPQLQEVKIEKAQKQQGTFSQKRADYAFSLEPHYKQTKFFVEAKKPSRTLRQNKDDYFQTAKYGWNAATGISVLTDFEEFVIIDCRYRPDIGTILSTQIEYYHFLEFRNEEEFKEVYWLFSREALLAGNLERFVEELPKPKGLTKQLKLFGGKYLSIDESFLTYIGEKRQDLATAFYQNNKKLDAYQLTEATVRTIDRIVFIRFLEDKSIETTSIINTIASDPHPWAKFIDTTKILNAKYNGVVFKHLFIDDNNFNGPDENLFRELLSELDHTNSPYDFNYIPVHILGSIYEQFLGKVVTIEKGKATIIDKPEVKKAGGVFYTPKYIVDYIVKHTVNVLIEGKTPKQVSTLTFADIACGSGSFLIGVFESLLTFHNIFYNNNPDIAKKDGCKFDQDNGVWVLSIKQKQQILINNIYGVDLDSQATEVTQLSLFLKMLEDETTATANDMMVLFHETILPNLSNNIKSGNSLIGRDIWESKLDLGLEEERQLRPFDFESAFPKVHKNGGFDAIVGNPPYVFTRDVEIPDFVKDYYWQLYKLTKTEGGKKNQSGKVNLYVLFILRGLKLINKKGFLSYIVPNGILRTTTYDTCRKYFLENSAIERIVDLKEGVFKKVTTSTIILSLKDKGYKEPTKIIDAHFKVDQFIDDERSKFVNQTDFLRNTSYAISLFIGPAELILFDKMKETEFYLKDIMKDIIEGIVAHKHLIGNKKIDKNYYALIEGKDIKRHQINFGGNFINWKTDEIHRTRPDYLWELREKIITQRISGGNMPIVCAIDYDKRRSFASTNIVVLKSPFDKTYGYKFVCALLNSKLINFFYYKNFTNGSDLTVNISKTYLEQIPIPKMNDKNSRIHDKIIEQVTLLDTTKAQKIQAITERDIDFVTNKIDIIEMNINKYIYNLYDLDEEQINIVETAYS